VLISGSSLSCQHQVWGASFFNGPYRIYNLKTFLTDASLNVFVENFLPIKSSNISSDYRRSQLFICLV
ncbi:MAG: hypothetical protein QNK29_14405, partial [Desulfobacterales bacterium]|nr:hypothetical protein [Desulfobacterales bacterium]